MHFSYYSGLQTVLHIETTSRGDKTETLGYLSPWTSESLLGKGFIFFWLPSGKAEVESGQMAFSRSYDKETTSLCY